jgi:hypothetical protein
MLHWTGLGHQELTLFGLQLFYYQRRVIVHHTHRDLTIGGRIPAISDIKLWQDQSEYLSSSTTIYLTTKPLSLFRHFSLGDSNSQQRNNVIAHSRTNPGVEVSTTASRSFSV